MAGGCETVAARQWLLAGAHARATRAPGFSDTACLPAARAAPSCTPPPTCTPHPAGVKGGRRITPAGQKDMDLIAGRIVVKMPTLGFAGGAADEE